MWCLGQNDLSLYLLTLYQCMTHICSVSSSPLTNKCSHTHSPVTSCTTGESVYIHVPVGTACWQWRIAEHMMTNHLMLATTLWRKWPQNPPPLLRCSQFVSSSCTWVSGGGWRDRPVPHWSQPALESVGLTQQVSAGTGGRVRGGEGGDGSKS